MGTPERITLVGVAEVSGHFRVTPQQRHAMTTAVKGPVTGLSLSIPGAEGEHHREKKKKRDRERHYEESKK